MASALFDPLQQFHDTDGKPLEDGYLYFGTANQNPQVNPITVYWDAAGTIPAAQPIRTSGGFPVRSGTAARVYVSADDYSLVVRDKNQRLVLSKLTADGFSSAFITFLQSGTGAVTRTAQAKMGEWVSVLDFGAVGDGVTDDTAAIQAAITYAKTFSATQTEVNIYWPAGDYKVTTLNYFAAERITNVASGSVNIYGTSVGGIAILSVDGLSTTFTRRLNWEGNFAVQIGVGGSYQYGVYINGLIDSRWNMSVSGAFSVNTVYIDYSFDNTQLSFYASNSSGSAVATVFCGQNSVNRNNFILRTTGSSNMAVASIGFELAGNANTVEGDFSSSQIGIRINAARGCTIISPYMETVKYGVSTFGNPLGTTIAGGLYEVGSNGAAFDLSSSQNTTITGARIFGLAGGSVRTAFILGTGCYGLSVIQPDIDATTIDAPYTGTWRGHGGFTNQFTTLTAQWLAFPPTQVASTDPNTLDDYEEGTWTPVGTGVTLSTATGRYTKIGDICTLFFEIVFPATADATLVSITGLPFSAGATTRNGAALGFSVNPSNHTLVAVNSAIQIYNNAGSGRTNANCSTNQYYGTLTYKVGG